VANDLTHIFKIARARGYDLIEYEILRRAVFYGSALYVEGALEE
jgi:hypothetical protein